MGSSSEFSRNIANILGSPPKVGGLATARTTSSSSEELLENKSADSAESLDQDANAPTIENLGQKLSPPIPKRPIVPPYTGVRSETPPLRKFGIQDHRKGSQKGGEKVENNVCPSGESSLDSSTDSLIDSQSAKIKGKKSKDKFSAPLKSPPHGAKSQGSVKSKLGLFKQTSGDKEEENVKATGKGKFPKEVASASVSNAGTVPGAGHKLALAGAKAVLPSMGPVLASPKQIPARSALHHISTDKEPAGTDESAPVSKDMVISLSKHLAKSLDNLNSAASKHSSNFLQLSEEVQSFYRACSSYVESLPPHGKFKFQELLTRLERVAEGLKTCSSSSVREYDKLLTDLYSSLAEIDNVLKK